MKDQNRGGKPNFEHGHREAPNGRGHGNANHGGKPFGERRENQPHGNMNRGDKPFGERRENQPHGNMNRGDKPFGERRENQPHGNMNRGNRPFGERPARPHDERPTGDFAPRMPKGEFGPDAPRPEFKPREPKPEFAPRMPKGEFRPDAPRPEFKPREPKPDFRPREPRARFDRRMPRGDFGMRPLPDLNGLPAGFRVLTARDAALCALHDVVQNGAFASQALDRSLNSATLSAEDRRLAASIFYFSVENRLYLEWVLNHFLQTKPEPLVADVLHIATAQILFMNGVADYAAVDEAVKQVRALGREGLTGLVNGVLRSLIRMRDEGGLELPDREEDAVKYLSVRYSFSEAFAKRLIAGYGLEAAEAFAAYVPTDHAQVVRVNRLKIDAESFERRLTDAGYHWQKSVIPDAYRIADAGDLSSAEDFRAGLFSIQGESSQLAALAVEAKPGEQILDACAAPGGKTCLMAEKMRDTGRVFAWDVYDHRVDLIRAAAKRLGLENVRPMTHDARRAPESMEMSMDAVLVDAPCSGLGVMNDKPDVKYRAQEDSLAALPALQAQILDACAKCVRPGGRLVYSTCTVLPEENQQQIRAFLERHPEFEADTHTSWLPESLREYSQNGMLTVLPNRDGMEGFFIARLIRRDF